jgi:hypothetical protein
MVFVSRVAALLLLLSSSTAEASASTTVVDGRSMPMPQTDARRRVVEVASSAVADEKWETLLSDTFEDGSWDPTRWSTERQTMPHRSHQGTYSVRFAKNNNEIELLHNVHNSAASYDLVKIQFFFKAWGMKTIADHRMGLDISKDGGATWTTGVKEWVYPQDYQVKRWYDTTVIVDPFLNVFDTDAAAFAAQALSSESLDDKAVLTDQFRFRLTMKGITLWTEVLHVDDVVVSGIASEPDTLPDDKLPLVSYCPVGRKELPSSNEAIIMPILSDGDVTDDISYMVQSRQTYGTSFHKVAWIGSDGSQYSITAVDLTTGVLICTYQLSFHTASAMGSGNWESMSLGPCTSSTSSADADAMCLYLGNTGNNRAEYCLPGDEACAGARSVLEIYKLQEPNINMACPSSTSTSPAVDVATIQLDYTHEAMPMAFADSDALFVDFLGDSSPGGNMGDIYMVTKSKAQGDLSRLVKIPVSAHDFLAPGVITPEPFSVIPVASPGGLMWSGADMSNDGRLITLRDLDYVYFYSRNPGQSVAAAIVAGPCPFASTTHLQYQLRDYETVALVGSDQMMEVSECRHDGCDVKVAQYALWSQQNDLLDLKVGVWQEISVEDFDLLESESASLWSTPTFTFANDSVQDVGSYVITPAKSAELTYHHDTTTMLTGFKSLDYDQVRVVFSFYMTGFDNIVTSPVQQFYLEVSFNNGAYWIRVKAWTYHRGVVNDKQYVDEVVFLDRANDFLVNSYSTKFRFRLDVDEEAADAAYLYIDNIAVQGRTLALNPEPPTSEDELLDAVDVMEQYCPVARKYMLPYQIPSLGEITDNVSYMAHSAQVYMGANANADGELDNTLEQHVVWMGSDGDMSSITAVVLETQERLCTYQLSFHDDAGQNNANNWESTSLGPCTSHQEDDSTASCLYLGNTGNSNAEDCDSRICDPVTNYSGNQVLEIYKLQEPDLNSGCPAQGILTPVSTIQVDFLHERMPTDHADSHAMFVDLTGDSSSVDANKGDIYMVTKNLSNGDLLSRVVKIPVAVHQGMGGPEADITPEPFSVIPVATPERGLVWEGADMSLDGTLITLRDLNHVYFFPRPAWQSVADTLRGNPCPFASITKQDSPDRENYESVAFLAGSKFVSEMSECGSETPGCSPWMSVYELLKNADVTVSDWTVLSNEDFEGYTAIDFQWQISTTDTAILADNGGEDPISLSIDRQTSDSALASLAMRSYSKSTFQGAIDATSATQLRVQFNFYLDNFEDTSDNFYLMASNVLPAGDDDDHWVELKEWNFQRGVVNDKWYMDEVVIIDSATIALTDTMRFRFVSDSSSLENILYLDDISISSRTVESNEPPLSDEADVYSFGGEPKNEPSVRRVLRRRE